MVAIADALSLDVGFFLPAGSMPVGTADLDAARADLLFAVNVATKAADDMNAAAQRLKTAAARLGLDASA